MKPRRNILDMRLVQVFLKRRFIVVLSIIYLSIVVFLYQHLWVAYSLDSGLTLLDFAQNPPDRDQVGFSEEVDFNFKRRNRLLPSNKTAQPAWNSSQHKVMTNRNLSPTISNATAPVYDLSKLAAPSACIHAFYYMWYGNPEKDGKYFHWNHRYLPHWDELISVKHPHGKHRPPDDIGASFYPELGCYSSSDLRVIETHMFQLRKAGVGVVCASWYPAGLADDEGFPPDTLIPLLLNIAQAYSMQVAFHLEPYSGRTPQTVKNDIKYIVKNYSKHPAFYRLNRTDSRGINRPLPLVYVYDSYLSTATAWASVLQPGQPNSIRGTDVDCTVLGLLVKRSHQKLILNGGFDGFYTYFASNGFSYGSTTRNWDSLAAFARNNGLIFVPSIGPGYDDVRVRPWNGSNRKNRDGGAYYKAMFIAAIAAGAKLVSLTSFNEWHEGTQIEATIPKRISGFTYADFSPHQPDFYLQLTREFAQYMQCLLP